MSGGLCMRGGHECAGAVPDWDVQREHGSDGRGRVCAVSCGTVLRIDESDGADGRVCNRVLLLGRKWQRESGGRVGSGRRVSGGVVLSGGIGVAARVCGGDVSEHVGPVVVCCVSARALLSGECDRVCVYGVPARALLCRGHAVCDGVSVCGGDVQQPDAGEQQWGLPRVSCGPVLWWVGPCGAERAVPGRVLLSGRCDERCAVGRRGDGRGVCCGDVLCCWEREYDAVCGGPVLRDERAGVAERAVCGRVCVQRGSAECGACGRCWGWRAAVRPRGVLCGRERVGGAVSGWDVPEHDARDGD